MLYRVERNKNHGWMKTQEGGPMDPEWEEVMVGTRTECQVEILWRLKMLGSSTASLRMKEAP